jgi:hypothetical protein
MKYLFLMNKTLTVFFLNFHNFYKKELKVVFEVFEKPL